MAKELQRVYLDDTEGKKPPLQRVILDDAPNPELTRIQGNVASALRTVGQSMPVTGETEQRSTMATIGGAYAHQAATAESDYFRSAAKATGRTGVELTAGTVESPAAVAGLAGQAPGALQRVKPMAQLIGTVGAMSAYNKIKSFAALVSGDIEAARQSQMPSETQQEVVQGIMEEPGNVQAMDMAELTDQTLQPAFQQLGVPFEDAAKRIRSLNESKILEPIWNLQGKTLGQKLKDPPLVGSGLRRGRKLNDCVPAPRCGREQDRAYHGHDTGGCGRTRHDGIQRDADCF